MQREFDNSNTNFRSNMANTISEEEHYILQNFQNKMDSIEYKNCHVCNECIPLMTLVKGMYQRCNSKKKILKKFSKENNIDPGNILKEF